MDYRKIYREGLFASDEAYKLQDYLRRGRIADYVDSRLHGIDITQGLIDYAEKWLIDVDYPFDILAKIIFSIRDYKWSDPEQVCVTSLSMNDNPRGGLTLSCVVVDYAGSFSQFELAEYFKNIDSDWEVQTLDSCCGVRIRVNIK